VIRRKILSLALTMASAFMLMACAGATNPPPSGVSAPPQSASPLAGIGAETVLTVHGKIASVDREKKTVTLQAASGKQITLTVQNPYNLESAKAGDPFVAQFRETITIVGKGPSPNPTPATLKEGLWTAAPNQRPGAAAARQLQFAVVVAAVDAADQRVTLRAPDGTQETVHIANPETLAGVQVGDQLIITMIQSVAIALAREPAS
jgi:hypothetical protein